MSGTGTPASTERSGSNGPLIVNEIIHVATPLAPPARPVTLKASALRVSRTVRLGVARSRGIPATFTVPRGGGGVVRVRLFRAASSKPVATKIVDLTKAGRLSVHLRTRKARAGRYRLEIALAPRDAAFSAPSSVALRLVRQRPARPAAGRELRVAG